MGPLWGRTRFAKDVHILPSLSAPAGAALSLGPVGPAKTAEYAHPSLFSLFCVFAARCSLNVYTTRLLHKLLIFVEVFRA
ncbi:MAG: hypothetical protein A2854_00170 [Parcubacteria group bacterium RIFCSPHIGHO2_01_FULL_56_18]|nr:MAG: hypothetical protein A2854_00170 [Parcubacteria group bacterium RIFCSPHIGHO2_01_FULL_56_18]